jgi:archaellum biogenesis ATPase FlaH
MSKEFKDMTKKELFEVIEKHSIPVIAKDESKPTNKELIESIEAFNNRFADIKEVEEKPVIKNGKKQSTKKELQKADLLRKERVIVIDTQRFQSLNEDVENLTTPVSFSNGIVEADVLVQLNGEPQYLERGIIQRLEDVMLNETTQSSEKISAIRSTRRKRYNIMQVGGMTDEEIEAQRKREMARGLA